ncbi:MAG: hypothetical protein IKM25_04520 [Clostridia bacterium]|nr:hypothetical protein [Clostridia bacterium]
MKKLLSFLLVFAVLFVSNAFIAYADNGATCYYIDSIDGDDANSGTSAEEAVKSIAGLKDLNIGPGTHFFFRSGGEYECAVTLTCSGTKENPVVITSYGEGERPLLYTNANTEVFRLFDCNYVTVSNVHIKAPHGGGIWIDALEATSVGIVLENILFTDMQNYKVTARDDFSRGAAPARAAVMVKGLPARSRYAVNDLTVTGCEVYNCANGVMLWGSWNDEQAPWCEEEDIDPIFNTGILVEDCYFHEMDAEAVVVGICDGALITNCRSINCCQGVGLDENGEIQYFTAAMWFWGSVNSTIQYCEIAGQKNYGDGMAVDFDSYTHNCTYQYIYSHDNVRFMCNCPNHSGHHNNTVRYCLSVNDNGGRSRISANPGEHNISFYNNTIVNCGNFHLIDMYDSLVVNNIIIPKDGCFVAYDVWDLPRDGNIIGNNCYYGCEPPLIDLGSMNTVPGFAGTDYSDPESFKLSADSPLIGAGYNVEGCDAPHDFYGNEIVSNNIGCYMGEGEDVPYEGEGFFTKIFRICRSIFMRIIYEMKILLEDWGFQI